MVGCNIRLDSELILESRVEAGLNTSTVALRIVGGDEKGPQCKGVYLGHSVLGGYKYRDLGSRLEESRI
jgi:hypothetical protein